MRPRHRAGHEYGNHLLVRDQRHERHALRPGRLQEPRAHDLRGGGVVDREGRRFEDRSRDTRRLVVEIDAEAAEPQQILTVQAPGDSRGSAALLVDEVETRDLGVHELLDLLEQAVGERLRVVAGDGRSSSGRRLGGVGNRAHRRAAERLRIRKRHDGREPDQDGSGKAQPDVAAERLAVGDDDNAVHESNHPHDDKHEEGPEIGESYPAAL
jgi:hypothetical protein